MSKCSGLIFSSTFEVSIGTGRFFGSMPPEGPHRVREREREQPERERERESESERATPYETTTGSHEPKLADKR